MDALFEWLHGVVVWLVHFVEQMGYVGIFIMTLVESTFVPIPAETTMIPAGYLVYQGRMDFMLVFISSVLGTITGSYVNYWIARKYGRELFLRHGKYFMMTPEKLDKLEKFVAKHGAISTFIGRLIPGVRHYISFPAGLARMNLKTFIFYTGLGGGIWMLCLIGFGYWVGANEEVAKQYIPIIKYSIAGLFLLGGGLYAWKHYRASRRQSDAA